MEKLTCVDFYIYLGVVFNFSMRGIEERLKLLGCMPLHSLVWDTNEFGPFSPVMDFYDQGSFSLSSIEIHKFREPLLKGRPQAGLIQKQMSKLLQKAVLTSKRPQNKHTNHLVQGHCFRCPRIWWSPHRSFGSNWEYMISLLKIKHNSPSS